MGDMEERGGYAGDQTVKEVDDDDDDDAGGKGRVFFSEKKKKKDENKETEHPLPDIRKNSDLLPLR